MSTKVEPAGGSPAGRRSIGDALKAARRRRRISLERASAESRIRKEVLVRLEAGDLEHVAPGYVRHFVRSYARLLRIDAEPLLAELDEPDADPAAGEAQALAQSFHVTARPYEPRRAKWTWMVGAASVVLVGLFLVGMLAETPARDGPVAGAKPAPPPAPRPADAAERTPPGMQRAGRTIDANPASAATGRARSDEASAGSSTPRLTRATLVAARGRCWVEVVADGDVVFRGMIERGSSRRFTAKNDMSLVLGYPIGVDLIVNGRDYGPPGGEEVRTISIPADLDALAQAPPDPLRR